MSTPQTPLKEHQHIMSPSRLIEVPPLTDEKAFTQASSPSVALFKDIEAGRHIEQHRLIEHMWHWVKAGGFEVPPVVILTAEK